MKLLCAYPQENAVSFYLWLIGFVLPRLYCMRSALLSWILAKFPIQVPLLDRTFKHCVIHCRIVDTMPVKDLPTQTDFRTRIMAIRDNDIRPLYDLSPQGPGSPSSSILIERHELQPTEWQNLIIPDQLLTLHLRRGEFEYEGSDGRRQFQTRARGSVTIERRGCRQKLRWNSCASILTVRLSDAVLEQASKSVPVAGDVVLGDAAARDMRLSSLLFSLERERIQGYSSGRLFVDGIEQALAAIVVRYHESARPSARVYKGGLAPYRMRRVTEFIRAHIEEEITLHELAKDVGLSPSHFCSLFRKTSGITPHQFVLHCRIQHAKSLLGNSGHSILDVALASGFRTHQHFSRIFRREVGIPPSSYRSQT